MAEPVRFTVREIELYERPVVLRLPFRFGVVTLTESPQAFARARIEFADGQSAWGAAAEMMAPKWFDKNLQLSNEDNFEQLRDVLRLARDAYLGDAAPASAFGHFARHYDSHLAAASRKGLQPAAGQLWPRAARPRRARCALPPSRRVLLRGRAVQPARDRRRAPRVQRLSISTGSCRGCGPPATSRRATRWAWSTRSRQRTWPSASTTACPRRWKKWCRPTATATSSSRSAASSTPTWRGWRRIAAVLDRLPEPYFVSLDGNEQYEDAQGVAALAAAIRGRPALQRLWASTLFIEQPIARKLALDIDLRTAGLGKPVIIDESDGELDTFVRARERGYAGVSSKTCKGLYKSILNAARCAAWNAEEGSARYFMSAEDLTTQAGLSVQQDLALVNLLGIRHVERNGHHYVNGMAAQPQAEQDAFLAAHPDVYERTHGAVRLKIRDGRIAIGSLACTGYASAAMPDFGAMTRLSPGS